MQQKRRKILKEGSDICQAEREAHSGDPGERNSIMLAVEEVLARERGWEQKIAEDTAGP